MPVFHHHAHASALAGEHKLEAQMLIFTWDGTGYGEDGTIWGGEALLGRPGSWRRVASFRPFYLPGGNKASREPWRCALSLCWEEGIDWLDCAEDASLLRKVWEQRINCPAASSAGRLFDAAAALIGVAHSSTYEGHAAMRMEAISAPCSEAIVLPNSENSSSVLISNWGPLLPVLMNKEISADKRSSVFHSSLAHTVASQAKVLSDKHSFTCVGLSGGVFQNRLLTEQAKTALEKLGFKVYLHKEIPSGDGGICFGQVIEAGSKQA